MKRCPHCQATTRQHKVGKAKDGLQNYRCLHCKQTYTLDSGHTSTFGSVSEKARAMNMPAPAVLAPMMAANPVPELKPAMAPAEAQASTPVGTAFPVKKKRGFYSDFREWAGTANSWGWLPEIAVVQSLILLLVAWTFVQARAGSGSAEQYLWMGLAMLILPVAFRLASAQPARRERIGLILLLGMSLFLVKVMHSPLAFTFPDELSHLRNVNEILRTHHLFQENPVQPVTAFYPGLPTVTSTLVAVSGLSTFPAGILVIGMARLILFLSLFVLFEEVSGSARVAGLGVLLYMANPNFLYWTAEYAYEPLALPFLVFVLLAVAKRETARDRRHHIAWTVVALMGLLTVVITHHMSSYILTALLVALVVIYGIRSRGKQWGPWDLALVALLVTSSWLIFVANLTFEYLKPVLFGAVRSFFNLVVEEEKSRQLFTSGSTGGSAPIWEQIVGMGSVILIALGLPFGLYEIWEKHRDRAFALLLGLIALVYLPMQMLRFSKAGWETANRSSEFLFIGIGFVVALGIVNYGFSRLTVWKTQSVLAVLAVVLFFGGLIAGWPPRARLPHAYAVSAGNHLIKPQVVTVSEWVLDNLGPDNRIAAPKADAKMLGAYNQYPYSDTGSSIRKMLDSEVVGNAEEVTLSKRNIEFVVADRRVISWDHMLGYYLYKDQSLELFAPSTFEKFDGLAGVSRMLDAGDIVIYDVARYIALHNGVSETTLTVGRQP
jgi:hypothetical protein